MTFQSRWRRGNAVILELEEYNEGSNIEGRGSQFVAAHRNGADLPASLQRPNVNPLFEKALERLALRSASQVGEDSSEPWRLWTIFSRGRRFVEGLCNTRWGKGESRFQQQRGQRARLSHGLTS